MSTITIRDATVEDAAGLAPLLAALGYPAPPETIARRLAELHQTDPTGRTLVAEVETVLHGFVTLHVTPVLHRATSVGRITGIAVHPAARGSGIGRRLVEAAEAHFRRLGLGRVEVTSGDSHRPAHEFYRYLGYEEHGVRLARTLPPEAPASSRRD